MPTITAWGNREAGAPLTAQQIYVDDPGPDEVLLEVLYCGLCHSDLGHINEARGGESALVVAGHEVVGRIVAVGSEVDPGRLGSLCGLGFISGTCRHCPHCLSGRQTLCADLESTILGRPGGFASHVKAHQDWVIPLPEELEAASAGPCCAQG